MKMSKLSNQTNSQDPQAVNSRVFVGNLNTFQCSKTDVERMFQKYGRLVGISMHKGYAFVQFTNPFDARNACHGEDGRTILSQVLDVNMVAEPKAHQTGRKRQNLTKTGNDWDYYYDSYYASTLFAPTPTRPSKRQRLMAPQNRLTLANNKLNSTLPTTIPQAQLQQQQFQQQQNLQLQHLQQQQQLQQHQPILVYPSSPTSNANNITSNNSISLCNGTNGDINGAQYTNGQHSAGPFKTYSNPDTLICGNCRELFTDLAELLDHKRAYCKLRFTCKCQESVSPSSTSSVNNNPSVKLLCVVCKESFANPWDLMVHAQAAHMINIYELGDSDDEKTDTEVSDEVSSINNDVVHMNGVEQNDKVNGSVSQQEDNHNKNDETNSNNSEYVTFENLPHDDIMKINGNGHDMMSHSDTSGEESNNSSPRTCIMSIEATTEVLPALAMVSSPLSISIGNGVLTSK